jgi:hypothetical protein
VVGLVGFVCWYVDITFVGEVGFAGHAVA